MDTIFYATVKGHTNIARETLLKTNYPSITLYKTHGGYFVSDISWHIAMSATSLLQAMVQS